MIVGLNFAPVWSGAAATPSGQQIAFGLLNLHPKEENTDYRVLSNTIIIIIIIISIELLLDRRAIFGCCNKVQGFRQKLRRNSDQI